MESIVILGQDARMNYVSETLYNLGYEVSQEYGDVELSAVMVLPPVLDEALLEHMLENPCYNKKIFYGILSDKVLEFFLSNGNLCESYLKWDGVVKENGMLTAKGIIREAVNEAAVLKESHCLVTGFGACGSAIAEILQQQGAHVDVLVRRKELRDSIEGCGYGFLLLNQKGKYDYIKYSYIFNTIPALIFDAEMLSRLSSGSYIFDIASRPGGVDYAYCKTHDIHAGLYLGIPGKQFPREAGDIIGKNIAFYLMNSNSSL